VSTDKTEFDYIILGAGIYGLYASCLLLKKNYRVALVECDNEVFSRASYANQARVHNGYHYPRSVLTARASANNYQLFIDDFKDAINSNFEKIYALSNRNSFTAGKHFEKFCKYLNIPCDEINPEKYFRKGTVEMAYTTLECSFDPISVKNILYGKIIENPNFYLFVNKQLYTVAEKQKKYSLRFSDKTSLFAPRVLNATYASINQVLDKFHFKKLDIKYEICEISLCDVPEELLHSGITVMDGPFFSLMPFGLTGFHSLSSVEFTPHNTSYRDLPHFECQMDSNLCTPEYLDNCNLCESRPETAFPYMSQLAKKYLKIDQLKHRQSLFAIKPILKASEIDDSRPTVIKTFSENPSFIAVLSGKINNIYDMGEVLI
tara:strand:- start:836 stop:1963 length:1128 start_codon:yes stop_codon:yes gene_type:complete